MLNVSFFKRFLFLSTKSDGKNDIKSSSKHLGIRFVYSSSDQSNVKGENSITHTDAHNQVLPNRLIEQKKKLQILLPQNTIEKVTLNESITLVGLTKHQPIAGGVIMYPEDIHGTNSWQDLAHQAKEQRTGIRIFKLLYPIIGLKVTPPNHANSISYLVDHRAIKPDRWLLSPSSPVQIQHENNHHRLRK
jgi:hypothetical protein